jgi:preprotein translocase subunit SecA
MDRFGMDEGEPIEHSFISKAIEQAQKKVEAHNFEIRKHLLEYDDVMNKQREVIYSQRKEILASESIRDWIINMIQDVVENLVAEVEEEKTPPSEWDLKVLSERFRGIFAFEPEIPQGLRDASELSEALRQ